MGLHAVRRIIREVPAGDGRVQATLELWCGCHIERTLDHNRLFTAEDGARIAAGKYPCPRGHPVSR